jgi:hypothetical protein
MATLDFLITRLQQSVETSKRLVTGSIDRNKSFHVVGYQRDDCDSMFSSCITVA